ncbi:hypothetical protein FAGAP_6197 [Fusarium agapanthi]|uniref:Uncharacterized protein n=1 Tax=Fusarium agapanthi TaxID=1803897 RepID=A0A9P5B9J7_9HYPO|nr:hypothetical protein FAGAP_6197 [Fusarium agapanthi]
MLLLPFIFNIAVFSIGAMALLVARDAIHVDDLDRYDEVMKTVAENHILNFYPENQIVKLDIHEYPSEQVGRCHVSVKSTVNQHLKIVRSEAFKPSPNADAYFKQEEELQQEYLHRPSGDGALEARAGACPRGEERQIEARASSRCFQFCGYVGHCSDRACPHCYYVGGGCQWQKWCRA